MSSVSNLDPRATHSDGRVDPLVTRDLLGPVKAKGFYCVDPFDEKTKVKPCSLKDIPALAGSKKGVTEYNLEIKSRCWTAGSMSDEIRHQLRKVYEAFILAEKSLRTCSDGNSTGDGYGGTLPSRGGDDVQTDTKFYIGSKVRLPSDFPQLLKGIGVEYNGKEKLHDHMQLAIDKLIENSHVDASGNVSLSEYFDEGRLYDAWSSKMSEDGRAEGKAADDIRLTSEYVFYQFVKKDTADEGKWGRELLSALRKCLYTVDDIEKTRPELLLEKRIPSFDDQGVRQFVSRCKVHPHQMPTLPELFKAFDTFPKCTGTSSSISPPVTRERFLPDKEIIVIRSGCLSHLLYKKHMAGRKGTILHGDKDVLYISSLPYFEQDLNSEGWQITRALCSKESAKDNMVVSPDHKDPIAQKAMREYYRVVELETNAPYRLIVTVDIPMRSHSGCAIRDSVHDQSNSSFYELDEDQEVSIEIKNLLLKGALMGCRDIVQVDRETQEEECHLPILVSTTKEDGCVNYYYEDNHFLSFKREIAQVLVRTKPEEYKKYDKLLMDAMKLDHSCGPQWVQHRLHQVLAEILQVLKTREVDEMKKDAKWDPSIKCGYAYELYFDSEVGQMMKLKAAKNSPLFGSKYLPPISDEQKEKWLGFLCKNKEKCTKIGCLYNHDEADWGRRRDEWNQKNTKGKNKGGARGGKGNRFQ